MQSVKTVNCRETKQTQGSNHEDTINKIKEPISEAGAKKMGVSV